MRDYRSGADDGLGPDPYARQEAETIAWSSGVCSAAGSGVAGFGVASALG